MLFSFGSNSSAHASLKINFRLITRCNIFNDIVPCIKSKLSFWLVKGKVVPAHCVKANVELEVRLQSFVTLLPDGASDELHISTPYR